ncbi:MAG: copper-binding protein [Rhodospirillales bacterium]|nr:copper-binding protein [Rhodospirillales bacterium]
MKSNHNTVKLALTAAVSVFLALNAPQAFAAGAHDDGHGKASPTGKAGKASDVTRTIKVMMGDNFYDMESLSVKGGETIRFQIKNTGSFVHEFSIGTKAMHAGHNKEMMRMMEHGALEADRINHDKMKMDMGGGKTMQHNDPNSTLLEPGKSSEIIWNFPKDAVAELEFACNVPGHYEAGMVGKVHFK